MKRTWQDIQEIAIDLAESNLDLDPMSVTLDQLKTMVVALPEFADDPKLGTEEILEEIQALWYDEFED